MAASRKRYPRPAPSHSSKEDPLLPPRKSAPPQQFQAVTDDDEEEEDESKSLESDSSSDGEGSLLPAPMKSSGKIPPLQIKKRTSSSSEAEESESSDEERPLPSSVKSSRKRPRGTQKKHSPSEESESSESESSSDEEAPLQSPSPPQQKPSSEESESSESESSSVEENPRLPPGKSSRKVPPTPKKMPSPYEESEDSDSKSLSSEEDHLPPPPKSSSKPSPRPPKQPDPAVSSHNREEGEEQSESSESEIKDRDAPLNSSEVEGADVDLEKKETYGPPVIEGKGIVKPWAMEDDIALLKMLLEYKDQHGKEPSSPKELQDFHASVENLFSVKISGKQLRNKRYNLQRRFKSNTKKVEDGFMFSDKEQYQLCFELSKKLWEKVADNGERMRKKRRGKEVKEVASAKKRKVNELKEEVDTINGIASQDDSRNPYEFLSISVNRIDNELKSTGKRPWLKERMMEMNPEILIKLERKCFIHYQNELKVIKGRLKIHAKIIKAIKEEEGIGGYSSSSDSG